MRLHEIAEMRHNCGVSCLHDGLDVGSLSAFWRIASLADINIGNSAYHYLACLPYQVPFTTPVIGFTISILSSSSSDSALPLRRGFLSRNHAIP